jgi:excinuclease ABC subunit B
LNTDFIPAGDQPGAIKELVNGIQANEQDQVLLGATGTGKTFTMAHIIENTQKPAIILAPNKTWQLSYMVNSKDFFLTTRLSIL